MRQKQGPGRHKADSAEILFFNFFFLYYNGQDLKSVDLDFLNGKTWGGILSFFAIYWES